MQRKRMVVGIGSLLAIGLTMTVLQGAGAKDSQSCLEDAGRQRFPTQGWETNFCKHSVPLDEIRAGIPGATARKDVIPAIDDPGFVSVKQAGAWLKDREPVIELVINGEARAYPLQIMTYHEIVNDTVGGTAITVTFCPLCYTALVFERPEHDGERLTFGTSGNLRMSDLVMYDRQTESWWQQFNGQAIVGDLTGKRLKPVPANIIAWETYREQHPDSKVLSRNTGHSRPYGRNPYVGYDDIENQPFLFDGKSDGRYPPMTRVVGVKTDTGRKAFTYKSLEASPVRNTTIDEMPVLVLWQKGTASAVSKAQIASGEDIGATAAYDRRVDGKTLTFELNDGKLRDQETNSVWGFDGKARSGALAGKQLKPLLHVDTFWFAWSAFVPEES